MAPLPPPKPVPSEPDDDATEDDEEERPTVVPEFDPQAFARDSEVKQRAAQSAGSEATIEQARQLHDEGDHEQALFLLRRLLELAPLHSEATTLSNDCRAALERDCMVALGSESAIFVVAVSKEELKRFDIDNVSAFLLSALDGSTDLETLLDISGLPRLLALRHLRSLLDRGLIAASS